MSAIIENIIINTLCKIIMLSCTTLLLLLLLLLLFVCLFVVMMHFKIVIIDMQMIATHC